MRPSHMFVYLCSLGFLNTFRVVSLARWQTAVRPDTPHSSNSARETEIYLLCLWLSCASSALIFLASLVQLIVFLPHTSYLLVLGIVSKTLLLILTLLPKCVFVLVCCCSLIKIVFRMKLVLVEIVLG